MEQNTDGCQHERTRLRKRAGVPSMMVQRQCTSCLRGVGEAKPLASFNATQQRVLEPWQDAPELGFDGPRAA